jgi:hypothetical protein
MWARQCETEENVLFVLAFGRARPGEKADVGGGSHGR